MASGIRDATWRQIDMKTKRVPVVSVSRGATAGRRKWRELAPHLPAA